ncbi:hypothetical protein ABTZ78_17235 [Streptomyces bauhiniae]|uniref:hypothetical protein n=1 Tax=Streptomyces bauhiniae TaxID=2340725 RepID=UPI00331BA433
MADTFEPGDAHDSSTMRDVDSAPEPRCLTHSSNSFDDDCSPPTAAQEFSDEPPFPTRPKPDPDLDLMPRRW